MKLNHKIPAGIIAAIMLLLFPSCEAKDHMITEKRFKNITTDRDAILLEMQQTLDQEFKSWYPASVDTMDGGFFSDMNYQWELDGRQNKMLATQARHIWSTANAFILYKKDKALLDIAAHGMEFLKNKMWDGEYGGFYDMVDRKGKPVSDVKLAYGTSFAIYALARYYEASGNKEALQFAQEIFRWMEQHSYDPQYGGYFQFMKRDGTPFTEGYGGTPPKDYNSMIHILESYTGLYNIWPDPALKERLLSLLLIVRDTITAEKGYLKFYFNRNWAHIPDEGNYQLDHISFGHDVETAYLMLEASEALGLKNDTTTLRIAKKMVDHTLANGFDQGNGGLYDGGYYFGNDEKPRIVRNTKEWWCQVEAFNAFLMMSDLFPNDEQKYYQKFCTQWNYCMNYLIDHDYGGWYWGGTDIEPDKKFSPKSSIWKCNYHTSRALINCINKLGK